MLFGADTSMEDLQNDDEAMVSTSDNSGLCMIAHNLMMNFQM